MKLHAILSRSNGDRIVWNVANCKQVYTARYDAKLQTEKDVEVCRSIDSIPSFLPFVQKAVQNIPLKKGDTFVFTNTFRIGRICKVEDIFWKWWKGYYIVLKFSDGESKDANGNMIPRYNTITIKNINSDDENLNTNILDSIQILNSEK